AIDRKLTDAGWVIQDKKRINLYESLGVAVREMDTDTGPADYMLFIDGKACGIIEAKREGTDLGGVAEQSARYASSQTKFIERWVSEDQPLPLLYEATKHEIRFRVERVPKPRSRYIFHSHRPETLLDRDNITTNTKDELKQPTIPHDGRKYSRHNNDLQKSLDHLKRYCAIEKQVNPAFFRYSFLDSTMLITNMRPVI
ncbi:MAG: hypothetical protein AB2777_21015, partial [Candidatus Thiodiazotropha endolucinida]